MILKRHLKSLSQGVFFQRPIRIRENDEFKDLIEAYNYLYFSLQAQIKKDVKTIAKALQQKDREQAEEILKELLDEKRSQISATVVETEKSDDSRHAS